MATPNIMSTHQPTNIKVYTPSEAKLLFRLLRKKGLIVSKGKNTGNIYSQDYQRKLAWMIKDTIGNWIIERFPP